MLILRKILFYLFLAIYVIFCPLIILDALGINFKPGTRGMEKTGVIYLSTTPAQANVYINQRLFDQRTPATIRGLEPGDYLIKLALQSYRPWKKLLSVKGEKATIAENILLIPQEWRSLEYSLSSFHDLISLGKQPFLLLSKGPYLKDLYIVKWSEGISQIFFSRNTPVNDPENIEPLFDKDFPLFQGKLRKYFSVKNSPFLLLVVEIDGQQKYLWVDLKSKTHRVEDLTDFFPFEPEYVTWEAREEKNIFILQKNMLNRLDIESKTLYPHIASQVYTLDVFDKKLYILTTNYILKQLDYNATNSLFISQDSEQNRNVFKESRHLNISVLTKDIIVFLDDDGTLLSNQPPFRHFLEKGVKGFTLDENKKRLLLWTNEKIGVLNFSKYFQDPMLQIGPVLTWLTLSGKNIQEAFWANNGSHILYQDNDKIFLLESEDFDRPTQHEIIDVKKGSSIYYSDESGVVFYLEPKTGQLSMIEILPRSIVNRNKP